MSGSGAGGGEPILRLTPGGHTAKVWWLGFTPDGRTLVSLGNDKAIRLWDVADPARPRLRATHRLQIGPGHEGKLYAGAISPDGRVLAVGGVGPQGQYGNIHLLDLAEGRVLRVLRGHTNAIHSLAFSPDGRLLASGSLDQTVRVWNLGLGRADLARDRGGERAAPTLASRAIAVLEGHENAIYGLAFLPPAGGRAYRLVSGSLDHTLRLWAVTPSAGGQAQARELSVGRGHEGEVTSVSVSPDGARIASASFDRTVRLWRAAADGKLSPTRTLTPGFSIEANNVAFSPDGRRLLAAGRRPHRIHVYDGDGGRATARFDGHDDTIMSLAWRPDGGLVASAGGNAKEILLWDPADGEPRGRIVGAGQSVFACAFSPDGRRVAFGNTNRGRELMAEDPLERVFDLFDVTLAGPLDAADVPVTADAWQRGRLTAAGDTAERDDEQVNTLIVRRNGREAARIQRSFVYDRIRCYAFTGDGRLVVGSNFNLTLHDAATGEQLRDFTGHTGTIWAVAVSPDRRYLISASGDQTLRLWSLDKTNVSQPTPRKSFPKPLVAFIEQHPDFADKRHLLDHQEGWGAFSKIMVERDGKHVSVTELYRPVAVSRPLMSIFITHADRFVAWTPQGYYKASAGADDLIGWHVNRGIDEAAEFYATWQFSRRLNRPDILENILTAGSVDAAVAQANADPHRRPDTASTDDMASLTPPKVTLHNPAQGQQVQGETVRVRATAQSRNGEPISRVTVLVNGRPIGGDKGISVRQRADPPRQTTREIDLTVPLTAGENRVAVVARTASSTSQPVGVIVTRQARQPLRPNLYVLAVGVSDYENDDIDLQFAARDATEFTRVLRGQQDRLFNRVKTRVVTDAEATRRKILRSLRWLKTEATQHDVAILFISGHGELGVDGQSYYFVPHDAELDFLEETAVHWARIDETLADIPGKVVLFMDTCYSAGLIEREGRTRSARGLDGLINELTGVEKGVVVYSSSTGREVSWERREWGHGAFPLAILEALTGRHKFRGSTETKLPADQNGDGAIDLIELDLYITHRVKELTNGHQRPVTERGNIPSFPLATN